MNYSTESVENYASENELNLRDQLEHLSQEFDCLGLPNINVHVNVLEQLITSIYNLIRLYRKLLSQNQEISLQQTILRKESISQKKAITCYQDKIKSKDSEIKLHLETIRKKCYDIDELKSEKSDVCKERDGIRSLYNRKEKEHIQTMTKIRLENLELKEKLGLDIGNYKQHDAKLIEVLTKYKAKEAIYEDTINKLQENNKHLLDEVLNLKEEIIIALCNKP